MAFQHTLTQSDSQLDFICKHPTFKSSHIQKSWRDTIPPSSNGPWMAKRRGDLFKVAMQVQGAHRVGEVPRCGLP